MIENVTITKCKSSSDVERTIKVMADDIPSLLDAIGEGDTLTIIMEKEEDGVTIIIRAKVKEADH